MTEKSNYDNSADKYIQAQNEYYKTHADLTRQILFKQLPELKDKKVLDVGCGAGEDSNELSKLGAEVIGIDISKEMIKRAQNNFKKIKFEVASADKLPFKENSFDIVYSRFALHYLDNVENEFKEIHRVIKPNGIMAILVPHPTGDYVFKENPDYGVKEMIKVPIYGNALDIYYPTHKLTEYLSPFVLTNFDIMSIEEALENPRKKTATGFMVLKLRKC